MLLEYLILFVLYVRRFQKNSVKTMRARCMFFMRPCQLRMVLVRFHVALDVELSCDSGIGALTMHHSTGVQTIPIVMEHLT